ncbi:morn repeat protein [Stylonychia lemnae]|uniref:Morn repeat protein n=1 Tax=Stylonychia lemnae TaxID=5949 RepID=A0A078A621_STYLE|nr:morn repeat protein [Stylonychia lemnae]|eukprot:CDW77644.1 morn repeat protein [Stylonychia lemnae]
MDQQYYRSKITVQDLTGETILFEKSTEEQAINRKKIVNSFLHRKIELKPKNHHLIYTLNDKQLDRQSKERYQVSIFGESQFKQTMTQLLATFLMASTQTTATLIINLLNYIEFLPNVHNNLIEEINLFRNHNKIVKTINLYVCIQVLIEAILDQQTGYKIDNDIPILVHFTLLHKNPKEWQEPDKFIPERFDPESPYFLTPDGKKESLGREMVQEFSCGLMDLRRLSIKFNLQNEIAQLMGNYCCSYSGQYNREANNHIKYKHLSTLIKIQSAMRRYLAKKRLKQTRDQKIRNLFSDEKGKNKSNSYLYSRNSVQNLQDSLEQSGIIVSWIQKLGEFKLNPEEYDAQDGVERVYIDQYKDVGDGKLYKGQWNKKLGERDGVGIQLWPDGSKYEGMWRKNKANGRGRMTHRNGDLYDGNWSDDKANGFGIFIDSNNAKYEGQWQNDLQHGQGIETWGDPQNIKAAYTGEFYKGKKNGKGRFDWEDGSYYEGGFVDGHFSGFGRYYFADLDKYYEGEFRMSNMEGKGMETWGDGRKYEGDFKNGKKDGEGTFDWPNGIKYIGSWRNGLQHGIGIIYTSQDGMKKQGEWQNGKRIRWISGLELLSQPNSPPKSSKASSPNKSLRIR